MSLCLPHLSACRQVSESFKVAALDTGVPIPAWVLGLDALLVTAFNSGRVLQLIVIECPAIGFLLVEVPSARLVVEVYLVHGAGPGTDVRCAMGAVLFVKPRVFCCAVTVNRVHFMIVNSGVHFRRPVVGGDDETAERAIMIHLVDPWAHLFAQV